MKKIEIAEGKNENMIAKENSYDGIEVLNLYRPYEMIITVFIATASEKRAAITGSKELFYTRVDYEKKYILIFETREEYLPFRKSIFFRKMGPYLEHPSFLSVSQGILEREFGLDFPISNERQFISLEFELSSKEPNDLYFQRSCPNITGDKIFELDGYNMLKVHNLPKEEEEFYNFSINNKGEILLDKEDTAPNWGNNGYTCSFDPKKSLEMDGEFFLFPEKSDAHGLVLMKIEEEGEYSFRYFSSGYEELLKKKFSGNVVS